MSFVPVASRSYEAFARGAMDDVLCGGRLRKDGGYTILVIEHDMHVVEGISDRVVALDHGEKIAEGTYEQVATNTRVVEAYLGASATERK